MPSFVASIETSASEFSPTDDGDTIPVFTEVILSLLFFSLTTTEAFVDASPFLASIEILPNVNALPLLTYTVLVLIALSVATFVNSNPFLGAIITEAETAPTAPLVTTSLLPGIQSFSHLQLHIYY